jgi:hypothetical protein
MIDICCQMIEVYDPKSWKPKSEAKAAPDIRTLKAHMSSFFDRSGNKVATSDQPDIVSLSERNAKMPSQIVEKIETPVEKIEKYSNQRSTHSHSGMNDRPPFPSAAFASASSLSVSAKVVENKIDSTTRSLEGNRTALPPPKPEFFPPPPPISTAKSNDAPPPTPDYVPPPPLPPSGITQHPLPTPEYLPPPPSPPQAGLQNPTKSHMNDLINDLLNHSDKPMPNSSGQAKMSSSSLGSSKNKRLLGSSTTIGRNGHMVSNGKVANSRDSQDSPPSYCSPPENHLLQSNESDMVSSSKRARLHYNGDGFVQ